MKVLTLASLATMLAFSSAEAQTSTKPAQPAEANVDKASAYYHFSLGHLYSELAGAYGNKGDYLSKAIENYRLAMKEDPDASFLAEELSDLYVQSGRLREAVAEAEESLKRNPNDLTARRILGRIYTRLIGDQQQGRVNDDMLKKAIEQYQQIATARPKDVETLLMLGRLQKIAQNSVESEKAYKSILEIDPENEDALTGLAIVYADVGNTKEAADLLRRVADKNPSLRTLTALASQYEQMRDYALAAETLRRTLDLAPDNVEVKRAYAQNLMLADRLDDALKIYQEVAAEDARDAQAHLRVSQIYRQKGDFAKAHEAAKKALDIDPNNLEVRYNQVSLLDAEGKTPEAIAALNEVLTATEKRSYSAGEKSNRIVLLERLALMYRNAEQYKEAVATFQRAAELDPKVGGRAAAQIIDTYRIAKDFDKALTEANAAYKKYPEDPLIRSVRASVLADTGNIAEAVAETKKMLGGENDRETYITLAQIYEKAKNYDEMAKAIDAAEKLSENQEEKEAVAFMRGAMFEKMKNFDAAEKEFRRVLEWNPRNASALNYLGYMLVDRDVRVPEALQLIQQAVDIDPTNGAYLDSLGWAYYRAGDLEKAERYLRSAVERFSKDPTVHDHLGDVYYKQGNLKDAISHWERSIAEWRNASASETDATAMAKVQKKLDSAKVRLAKESGGPPTQQR
jgi:tetratricopeptide (TPR) repeat protein